MSNILITGASGLLGSSLVPFLEIKGHNVIKLTNSKNQKTNIDLTEMEEIECKLANFNPDIVINLAALANVDECESNPQKAYLLNVKIVENLTKWIKTFSTNSHLIQISTDQVYDGSGHNSEETKMICNQYGMSKLAGEFAAMMTPSTILRTNFVGKSRCSNRLSLTDWIFNELTVGKEICVYQDIFFSPLSMLTLCEVIEKSVVNKPVGIYNAGSKKGMSKAEFAILFAQAVGMSPKCLKTGYSENNKARTKRPKDMRMDSSLIEAKLKLKLPTLEDEILRLAEEYIE